jgi:hypothetical protein
MFEDPNDELLREIAINLTGEDPGTDLSNNELLKIIAVATAQGGGTGEALSGGGVSFTPYDSVSNFGNAYLVANEDSPEGEVALYAPHKLYIGANTGADGSGSFNPTLELEEALGEDEVLYSRVYVRNGSGNQVFGEQVRFAAGVLDHSINGVSTAQLVVSSSSPPSSASDKGFTGEITWDADYIYICVDVDTWKRVPILTWA